jgi:hypothetical protein
MSGTETHIDEAMTSAEGGSIWQRKGAWIATAVVGLIGAMFLIAWLAREDIAESYIEDELAAYDLPASYEIESIGSRRQVFTNVVIGDPARPDFSAERIEVAVEYDFGAPKLGEIRLVSPRVYGRYFDGKFSLGSLDPIIFTDSDEPPSLPEIDISLEDGRALIETEFGPVGMKLDGEGALDSGFAGVLAVAAPDLRYGDCVAQGASAFGDVLTLAGEPRFTGPVRAAKLTCSDLELSLDALAAQLEMTSDAKFGSARAEAKLDTGELRYSGLITGGLRSAGVGGRLRAAYREDVLDLDHTIALRGAGGLQAQFGKLAFDGTVRARTGFSEWEARSEISGSAMRLGSVPRDLLAGLDGAGADTLLEPLAQKASAALAKALPGSVMQARMVARRTQDKTTVSVPSASVRTPSGAPLFALSQFELSMADGATPRMEGDIATGGEGLPRITGRMVGDGAGSNVFNLSMAEYAAGSSAIALPKMLVSQGRAGQLAFDGEVTMSGALAANAKVKGLSLPLRGTYSDNGGLALGQTCTNVAFDDLQVAGLRVQERAVSLCPGSAGAIVRRAPSGALKIAARLPSLELEGLLGETPLSFASSGIDFAYPGKVSARNVELALGEADAVNEVSLGLLEAEIGSEAKGSFADAKVNAGAIAFNVDEAAGNWSYGSDGLLLSDGAFRLSDKAQAARFNPLFARDATLTMREDKVLALAQLREPNSDRVVAATSVFHDLETAQGFANLKVPALLFDEGLQPDDLSVLTKGVIALARGVIYGEGRIEWSGNDVTSFGSFSSNDFDFAAAFGPVKNVRGTVEFVDLVSLTTAPSQVLEIGSVNPGIEVLDGTIEFAVTDGTLVSINGGKWPFMGGELVLRPTLLNFAVAEERRYTFEIVGLDAATFIDTLELGNLSGRGTFDGMVPIVFDTDGNGMIEDGLLLSRTPGGNVSYVGELTYEDMGAVADFAFDALRSLDYRQMSVGMEGPLIGEIVTRVRFDGVTQGVGTKSNIITRQLAQLPLQFRVNVRAQFYELLSGLKLLYDPVALNNLEKVQEATQAAAQSLQDAKAAETTINEPDIQDLESEDLP